MKHRSQSGFSLVEMIVSLGVFSIVITIAVGALLILIASNQQLQREQSVMTNLSFVLDSMTRELRTGTFYYCDGATGYTGANNIFDGGDDIDAILGNSTQDCPDGRVSGDELHGISFVESGDSITGASANRILYFFDGSSDETGGKLYRKIGDGEPQSIVSDGIFIRDAAFFVSGSEALGSGTTAVDQAAVTIFIEASESAGDPDADVFYIQTSVTQRTIDI